MNQADLVNKLREHFEVKDIIEDYSGRFMYDRTCVGIIVDDITSLIDIVPKELLQKSRGDYMGKRKIVYFPEVKK